MPDAAEYMKFPVGTRRIHGLGERDAGATAIPFRSVHTCSPAFTGVMPLLCAQENSFPSHVPQKV